MELASTTMDNIQDRTTSPDSRTGLSYGDVRLDDLVEEMARVRRRKDRLQNLQSLEEQEEELRKEIARRRSLLQFYDEQQSLGTFRES
ncbi:uncharacterized protein KD926_011638 [Aspergillus affinis]|uniref:uncharacterized protein n=1 Tax=Aspergillus affinis TaxID=1070780 RepID=UPI0022FE71ED|nr:uncharacterized protein KD926_011638 [Aspergillus affinis]KAI9044668.1 hypothetical protein KD926_011638 [Aspergillus affinis]